MAETRQLLSVGQIAELLGEKVERVRYALRSRGVASVGVVGRTHVYSSEQAHEIEAAVRGVARSPEPVDR